MRMTIEPTPEMCDAPVNGRMIPVRIWHGHTEGGIEVEAYVVSITPVNGESDVEQLREELPDFMMRSRVMYDIDTSKP